MIYLIYLIEKIVAKENLQKTLKDFNEFGRELGFCCINTRGSKVGTRTAAIKALK